MMDNPQRGNANIPMRLREDASDDENIILNPNFDNGINNWSGRGCKIVLHESLIDGKILPKLGKHFASASERTQTWNGIQQEITTRTKRKFAYQVTSLVRVFGKNASSANVQITLYLQMPDLREQYIVIARSGFFYAIFAHFISPDKDDHIKRKKLFFLVQPDDYLALLRRFPVA